MNDIAAGAPFDILAPKAAPIDTLIATAKQSPGHSAHMGQEVEVHCDP
jgi:hypothetical protein